MKSLTNLIDQGIKFDWLSKSAMGEYGSFLKDFGFE